MKLLLTTIAAVLLVGTAFADPIHDAARIGDLAGVQAELDKGVGVNATNDWDGSTPLHPAARWGHKKVAELLISRGADVNAKDNTDRTTLHNASAGWPKTLGWAASGGHMEVAELLIAAGADVNAKSDNGSTPLLFAALEGPKEIVELLIDKGADVNAKSDNGSTPLHSAASGHVPFGQIKTPSSRRDHQEVVEALIAAGADVNAMDDEGVAPLDSAWRDNQIADLFRKHGAKTGEELKAVKESIHVAVSYGNIEAVKQHLANGADVNGKDEERLTPLHSAVEGGHKELAELLITHDADVNAKGLYMGTPLHYAASEGHMEIVELLITRGADVNAKDVDGWTPLFNGYSNAGLIDLLIENGANPNLAFSDSFGLHFTVFDWYEHQARIADAFGLENKDVIRENANLIRKLGGKKYYELNPPGISISPQTATGTDNGGDAEVFISIHGAEGSTFDVLHSSNLNNWKVLKTVTIGMYRLVSLDPEKPLGSSFYKIRPID